MRFNEPGRNDPCPCGSGKKFKKCCAAAENAPPAAAPPLKHARHLQEIQARYASGNLEGAVQLAHQSALEFPTVSEFPYLLGSFLGRAGRLNEAEHWFSRALELNPQSEEAYLGLAGTYHNRHEYARVVTLIETAFAKLSNPSPELWYWYGFALHANDHMEEAIAAFRKVLDSPASPKLANEARDHLYYALLRKGETEEAAGLRERIRQTNPRSLADVSCLFVTPLIPQSVEEIASCRAEIRARLAALASSSLTVQEVDKVLQTSPFLLAFHGESDRALLSEACAALRRIAPELNYVAPHCRGYRPAPGKIRIGVISQYLYRHSVGSYFRGLITALHAHGGFEVLVMSPGGISDANALALKSNCDRFVPLPIFCTQARDAVARERCDILLYLDVGMNVFSYILPFFRLAPLQCVLPGHPDTTGIDTMDVYISSQRLEPENGQEHYSEALHNLAHFTAWGDTPLLPKQWDDKESIGFPAEGRVYFCPMTLYKIHPDFDAMVAAILARDAQARVVFVIPSMQARMADLVKARLAKRLGDPSRVLFIPWLKPDAFLSALHHADVILDPVHFGGGTTFYSIAAIGTPFVTLPDGIMRGRIGLAIATLLDVPELVADSVEDYAEKACRIAGDPALREGLRARMRAASHRLYGDQGSGKELAALLQSLLTQYSSSEAIPC